MSRCGRARAAPAGQPAAKAQCSRPISAWLTFAAVSMPLLAATAAETDRADVNRLLLSVGTDDASTSSWPPSHWAQIERISRADEAEVTSRISARKPVVIENGSIVPTSRWEDLETLSRTMANTTVLVKRSSRDRVAYFREDRNSGNHPFTASKYVQERKIPFSDFLSEANASQGKQCDRKQKDGNDVLYCQESFMNHPELQEEFSSWDWAWVIKQCKRHGWGLPETNVLFMGTESASTPAHFDEQHNFLNQVRGKKLVVLFPPDDYTRMYPFPVTHPCDRCSLVDVRDPDLERFPEFREVRGHVTTLGPGDVLYIPYGWWHYCRTETHLAASVTFWAQTSISGQPNVPAVMGPSEWTTARRNLEKLLQKDVGAENLDAEVLRILDLIDKDVKGDPKLKALTDMLGMLQVPEKDHLSFLSKTFRGRYGFDHSPYI